MNFEDPQIFCPHQHIRNAFTLFLVKRALVENELLQLPQLSYSPTQDLDGVAVEQDVGVREPQRLQAARIQQIVK